MDFSSFSKELKKQSFDSRNRANHRKLENFFESWSSIPQKLFLKQKNCFAPERLSIVISRRCLFFEAIKTLSIWEFVFEFIKGAFNKIFFEIFEIHYGVFNNISFSFCFTLISKGSKSSSLKDEKYTTAQLKRIF